MMGDPKRLGIWVSHGQVSKSSDVYLILWSLQSWAAKACRRMITFKLSNTSVLVVAEYRPLTGFVPQYILLIFFGKSDLKGKYFTVVVIFSNLISHFLGKTVENRP